MMNFTVNAKVEQRSNHRLIQLIQVTLLCLICSMQMLAQGDTKQVTGTVNDASGTPLIGVNILIEGTNQGTVTDINGQFSLEVATTDILRISYTGFSSISVPVESETTFNITMQEDAQQLDEIVVIGYGSVRKSDLTGSISQVSAKDFERQPLSRIEDALKGRAAGVVVTSSTGTPGGQMKIRVRGANSITGNNNPLVVIDGVIGGDLNSINTNDIASMDVLKDASATAIYGSRGANGVIIINTKKGSDEARVDVNYFYSATDIAKDIDIMNAQQFSQLYSTSITDGGYNYPDAYLQSGGVHNLQLSISGKENKLGYFISGNMVQQTGNIINTEYQRYNLRSNLNVEASDRLNIGLNLFASREYAKNFTQNGLRPDGDQRAGITAILSWDPTLPPYNADGSPNINSAYGSIINNPIVVQNNVDNNQWEDRLNANLNVSYDILENLNFTSILGVNTLNRINENYQDYQIHLPNGAPSAAGGFVRGIGLQNSNILTWSQQFGVHSLKLTGIYEITNAEERTGGFRANDFIFPATYALAEIAENQTGRANFNKNSLQSLVVRVEYSLDNNLLVTATLRRDESSKFRPDNRSAVFPSLAVAYNLRELEFIKSSNLFDNIKVRVGYGETGNQNVSNFLTYPTLSTGNNYPLDGASETVGLAPGRFENPDLFWETTKQFNAGLDFAFVRGRINFSVDYYKKNTTDLLLSVPVPSYAGGGSITRNSGEVENSGLEFLLSGVIVSKQNLKWNATLTAALNNNEVISLAGDQEQQLAGTSAIGGTGLNTHIYRIGQPLGAFYGATFLGTWKTSNAAENNQAPGDARYLRDADGNLILDIIGNGTPKVNWGFNTTATFSGFDFNLFVTGAHGYEVLNATRSMLSLATGNVLNATSTEYLDRWTPGNENEIPASGVNINQSTRYLESGSHVRLSNVTLGYTLPTIKGLRSTRLYISAQNALVLSDYSGYDPESSSSNDDRSPGLDFGAIPNPRSFSFGVNLGF